ncbi:O-antigen ligase family protein [Pedobacter arcticus]|uniref:O-antigen ligase family protein n=1 Tax=Pedobacter arcticus TaxID=752140 RepID=UPI00030CC8A7|nr:O-antigen ligase family protein [Pedobacter arcticus]
MKFFEADKFAWLCYLFVCCLFFSRAGLAISGVLMLTYTVAFYLKNPLKIALKPIHILFFSIYFVCVFSVLFVGKNLDYGLNLLFKNAIFLVLPLAFLLVKELSQKAVNRVFLLFIFSTICCVSINTVEALLNFNRFLQDVGNSKNIVPFIGPSHTELGVLIVVAFVLGFYLAIHSKNRKLKWLLLCGLALLFVELHIIAYRFSLVSTYLIIVLYCFAILIKKRDYKLFFLTVLGFVIALCILSLIPSVKIRFQNTITDITTVSENRNPNFQSVTQRALAVACATELIKEYPWFGVSPADANLKMQNQYAKNSYLLIPENRIFIHNQFLYYILCFGIPIGFLIGLSLVVLILRKAFSNPLLFWAMLPFLFHMMMENTLERQIAANAFIFMFLVVSRKSEQNTP